MSDILATYDYTLNGDNVSYSITCNNKIVATLAIIPGKYNNLPVTGIKASAFSECASLKNVMIPDSVTTIGESAFYSCGGLKNINIPESITAIGPTAFYGCSGLEGVTLLGTTPPTLGLGAFVGLAINAGLYCLHVSLDDYKEASGWSDYASKIYADDLRVGLALDSRASKEYFASKADLAEGLANKVTEITTTSSYDQVYTKNKNGTSSMYNVTDDKVANTIIARDDNGRAKVEKPSNSYDIANKKYVDENLLVLFDWT